MAMVASLAAGNFLCGLGSPHGAIWDESYYLTSTQWPLARGTINYRWDSDGVRTAYVQLVGNQVSWLLALAAPLAVLALLLLQRWRPLISRAASLRHALMVMVLAEYLPSWP